MFLKQSTAATVKLGPFVDATDGVTAKTALTISQADIRLSKAGGDFAQTNNSAGATHDEAGYYDVPLNTTDTNTLGPLRVAVAESGALPVWRDFFVVPAAAYRFLADTGYTTPNPTAPVTVGGINATGLALYSSLFNSVANVINANTTQLLTGIYAGDLPPNPTLTAPVVITAGDTLRQTFTIGDITGNSEIHFMVKAARTDADTAALIHISKTAGLEYIDGAAAGTAANGSLTVNDASTGNITVFLDEAETIKLQNNVTTSAVVGIKVIGSTALPDDAYTEAEGTATINAGIVQATS